MTRQSGRGARSAARLPTALDRILALGERASCYSEADLARGVGVSRERIRQLKVAGVLPHKPTSKRNVAPGTYEYLLDYIHSGKTDRIHKRLVLTKE